MKCLRIGLISAAVALGFGCSKDDDARTESPTRAAEYSARYSEVMTNWVSQKCSPLTGIPGPLQPYYKIEYDFPNPSDAFVERTHYFADSGCTEQLVVVKYAGNIEIRDPGNQVMGSKELNFTYKQAFVSAQNDKGRDFLNTLNVCGISNYQTPAPNVNHEIDVTAQSGEASCLGIVKNAKNRVRYDRYVVDNGTLYLGSGYKEDAGQEDPAKRPMDLQTDEPFVKR